MCAAQTRADSVLSRLKGIHAKKNPTTDQGFGKGGISQPGWEGKSQKLRASPRHSSYPVRKAWRGCQTLPREGSPTKYKGGCQMTESGKYLKIVEWSEEDQCFVGSCPGVIGPCCHGQDEVEVYRELCGIVEEWLAIAHREHQHLPPPPSAGTSPNGWPPPDPPEKAPRRHGVRRAGPRRSP